MTDGPDTPEGASSRSTGDSEGVPTAVDRRAAGPSAGVDAEPRAARLPPAGDEHITLLDARSRQGFLDLSEQLGALDDASFDARYREGEVIGRGGMGEIRLHTDLRIGRTVAIKAIRPDGQRRPRLRARFLFEAKMQGQLEHPSIVPVYDLGVRPDGSEYFTMRRVRGRTLHEILRALKLGERGAAVQFTRRRLLAAFQSVCLAVEFAHQRGVVHRDLKPANIMLGEFGEVIVLDWGLAKLVAPAEEEPRIADRPTLDDVRSLDTTGVGEVLGSPGYMSPEQAVDSQGVGPSSDVFALGAILFEVLTLRHLVPGESHADVTRATISGAFDAHIGKRFPDLDVPLELEAICVTATSPDPAQRYPRARDLADAVERFLEGDRDVARRRSMAGRHTRAAIAALAESVDAKGAEASRAARSRAIREVNHALAIDPQNQTALRTMMKIVTEAPSATAPEAAAEVRASEAQARSAAARRGSRAYLALAATIALMGVLGVESWPLLAAPSACFVGAAAVTRLAARTGEPRALGRVVTLVIALSSAGIALTSALFGPLVYAPSLCAANVVVFASGVARRYRWLALGAGLAALLLPLALELAGVIPPGWTIHGGTISITPRVIHFPGAAPVMGLLAFAIAGAVAFPVLILGAERDARVKAERELYARMKLLSEFVPAEAGEALTGRPSRSPPPGA